MNQFNEKTHVGAKVQSAGQGSVEERTSCADLARHATSSPYWPALRWWLCARRRCHKLARRHNKRAERYGMPGRLTPSQVQGVFRAADGCAACGGAAFLTLDHVVPLARGGENCTANLQALCMACHDAKDNPRSTSAAVALLLAEVH